jgi:hypothetical protein
MPLPSLIAEPPPTVQMTTGKVFRDRWADPQDDRPTAARVAREVAGWRSFCPLRRCIARHGDRSSFTADHVEAADRLRAAFDGARLGFSGIKDWRPVTAINHRPSQGPGAVALKQLRARKMFDRAWALFGELERALLLAVVLRNLSVTRAAAMGRLRQPLAMQRLIEALDRLVEHWDIGEGRQAA